MNPSLQQLKDIHLPKAVSMWPTAPGWIGLYIMMVGLIGYGIFYWYKRRKHRYTIKYALRQLNQLQTLTLHNPDNINIAAEISTLIRRTALYYFQRDAIAGLTGQEWLHFLNTSGNTTQFTTEAGQLLIAAPYRQDHHANLTPLFTLTQHWLTTIIKKKKEK
ncbi:MAG: DUF4381 domain-containing protein [Gammaproteobacteria bacterium]